MGKKNSGAYNFTFTAIPIQTATNNIDQYSPSRLKSLITTATVVSDKINKSGRTEKLEEACLNIIAVNNTTPITIKGYP